MRTFSVVAFFALAAPLYASGIVDSDIPDTCKEVCRPLVQLSTTCVTDTKNPLTSQESDCICKNKSFDVKSIGSLCSICVTMNNKMGDDLKAISSTCSFTATNYNQLSASSYAASITVTATKPGTNQVVTGTATATGASGGAKSTSSKGVAAAQTVGPMRAAAAMAGMGFIGYAAMV